MPSFCDAHGLLFLVLERSDKSVFSIMEVVQACFGAWNVLQFSFHVLNVSFHNCRHYAMLVDA